MTISPTSAKWSRAFYQQPSGFSGRFHHFPDVGEMVTHLAPPSLPVRPGACQHAGDQGFQGCALGHGNNRALMMRLARLAARSPKRPSQYAGHQHKPAKARQNEALAKANISPGRILRAISRSVSRSVMARGPFLRRPPMRQRRVCHSRPELGLALSP